MREKSGNNLDLMPNQSQPNCSISPRNANNANKDYCGWDESGRGSSKDPESRPSNKFNSLILYKQDNPIPEENY